MFNTSHTILHGPLKCCCFQESRHLYQSVWSIFVLLFTEIADTVFLPKDLEYDPLNQDDFTTEEDDIGKWKLHEEVEEKKRMWVQN